MGSNIKSQDIGYQIGAQSDRTTAASTFLDFAPNADAVGLMPVTETVEYDTDHFDPGVKYTDLTARNRSALPYATPLYPTIVGTLFNAVFIRNTAGDLDYHEIRRWWRSAIGGSEDKGETYRGCVFDSVNLSIARSDSNQPIVFDAQVMVNAKRRLLTGETSPTPDLSKQPAFGSAGVLIDFVSDDTVDSLGGDDAQVRAVSFSFSNQVSLDGVEDNLADPPLHRSWLTHVCGNPKLDITVTCRISDDNYLRLDEWTTVPKGKLRLAFTHPKGASITSTSTLNSGTTGNQTLNVAATAGFLAGDTVVIKHPTTGFAITKIVSLVTDTSITVGGYDPRVTLNGASGGPLTIRSMCAGLVVDSMDFKSRSSTKRAGAFQTIDLTYTATLKAGASFPLEILATDVANSRL
jgi:hypothetical protein